MNAEALLQKIRDHGPWYPDDYQQHDWCFYCGAPSDRDHRPECVWLEIEAATEDHSDD